MFHFRKLGVNNVNAQAATDELVAACAEDPHSEQCQQAISDATSPKLYEWIGTQLQPPLSAADVKAATDELKAKGDQPSANAQAVESFSQSHWEELEKKQAEIQIELATSLCGGDCSADDGDGDDSTADDTAEENNADDSTEGRRLLRGPTSRARKLGMFF